MKHELVFTESYTRRAIRFMRKHPELRNQYEKALELLEVNPNHPSLRLHRLGGRLSGLHSASINIAYRITIEFLLRRVRDRNVYREWLRVGVRRHGVSVYGYCITHNHALCGAPHK